MNEISEAAKTENIHEWFDKFLDEVVQTTVYKDERLKSAYMAIGIAIKTVKQINTSLLKELAAKDAEIERLKQAMCTAINDLEKIKGFRNEAPRLASAACRVLSKALKALASGEVEG